MKDFARFTFYERRNFKHVAENVKNGFYDGLKAVSKLVAQFN